MKVKRWISALFCTLLCAAVLPTAAFATEPPASVWDGSSVATAYDSGDGTEANPYEIATADQFAYFAEQINSGEGTGAHYVLGCDLDLSTADWTPIVNFSKGSFDGREHTITYSIHATNRSLIGLFGNAEADISNLNVAGSISLSTCPGPTYVGGLAGRFSGTLTNCDSNVDIAYVVNDMAWLYVGGLTGECRAGSIQECAYTGEITASTNYGSLNVGGISGMLYNAMIDSCKNAGTVAASGTSPGAPGGMVGGIVGYSSTATGSYVTGAIRNCYNEGSISGGTAGGVVGYASATQAGAISVENCYSSTMASGAGSQGAIVAARYAGGTGSVTIQNCYYLTGSDQCAEQKEDMDAVYAALRAATGEAVWKQDASGTPRLYWELTTNPTPKATFTATGNDGGTLSGVDASMKCSVDGGVTWNDVTGTTMEIAGVSAEQDVKVYRPGNGADTSDSEVQTIDVTQAAQPEGLAAADCTTSEQNDGQIAGVDATMEYRLSGASGWTPVTGDSVTGLADGVYEVRVKANGTVLASPAATVTIKAHACAAQGDWQHDKTGHWRLCSCGAKVSEAAHSGGNATCTASAACEVCGQHYGEKDPANHSGTEAWVTTEITHTKVHSCCQAVIEAEDEHTWANGTCAVCGYGCKHQGGTATCSQRAQCERCGSLYGDYDEDNHKAADTWTQEGDKHYHVCEYGCDTHLDEAACSGGAAICTAKAICETCGQAYGALGVHELSHTEKVDATCTAPGKEMYYTCEACGKYFEDEAAATEIANLGEYGVIPATGHTAGTEWKHDETNHWNECTTCGAKVNEAAHDFEWVTDREATATEAGSKHEKCAVCGYAKEAVEVPATGSPTEPTEPTTPDGVVAPTDTPTLDAEGKPADTAKSNDAANDATPQTGDNSGGALWIASAIVLATAATLIAAAIHIRKKSRNR